MGQAANPTQNPIKPNVTPHEALIYVMIMASAVDRVMSDLEMEAIGVIVRRLPAFEGFDKKKLLRVAQDCSTVLAKKDGFETALTIIAGSLSKDLQMTAYAFAVEVAAVDKTVNLEEVRLLEILAERFDLSDLDIAAVKQSAEARYRTL
jgi:tellurite resistance protein